ncbi:MAG: MarR family transcriptional regulator [Chloroflexi bacterium]|nr:MarR family transcriptional regulator [Chloroflexota bacterium]
METAQKQTPYKIAQMLLETLPSLGRLIAIHMRESGEEEATMMQIGVLMRIKDRSITTSELAKQRKVSLQSASVLVQNLVERGWVTREPDPNDRRQSLLQVTEEGLARAEAAQKQILELIADRLADFLPEELDAAAIFLPALQRVMISRFNSEPIPEK